MELKDWGSELEFKHAIPSKQPTSSSAEMDVPVNQAETKLLHLLLAAGFEQGERGKQISLGGALGTTTPDVIYHDPEGFHRGVCIYLDGMSNHLHGNPTTAGRDREIREWLRGSDYEVISIPANELDDEGAMTRHLGRLARYLGQQGIGQKLAEDRSWFNHPIEVTKAN